VSNEVTLRGQFRSIYGVVLPRRHELCFFEFEKSILLLRNLHIHLVLDAFKRSLNSLYFLSLLRHRIVHMGYLFPFFILPKNGIDEIYFVYIN